MLRLVRRRKSPNWIIRGTVRGIRVEETTGTSDRRFAEEIRAKRESETLRNPSTVVALPARSRKQH